MSRRDSRVSLDLRQNDALFEFENFKKKFLLANKHITKLNSTLSVKIEELNAEITVLYTENLRLRASEIALAKELKKEREHSRKILEDAESAASDLANRFRFLKGNACTSPESVKTSSSQQSPRAVQRPRTANSDGTSPPSPIYGRLSRPPNIPGIYEEDEPNTTSEDEAVRPRHTPPQKLRTKPRLSVSKLPLPSRATSPPPTTPHVDFSAKRKPRRVSGLLTSDAFLKSHALVRPDSPTFGSPIKKEVTLAPEEIDLNCDVKQEPTLDPLGTAVVKKEKKKSYKIKDVVPSQDHEPDSVQVFKDNEVKRSKDKTASESKKLKLKDVTNSPRRRPVLQLIDNDAREEPDLPAYPRTFLAMSPPQSTHLPTPAPSSPGPEQQSSTAGRERRERKSVNYAEPKLNTKMRRPDPPPEAVPKKRVSAAAVMSTSSFKLAAEDADIERASDMDAGGRSSVEFPLRIMENDVDPSLYPLPVSRPVSAGSGIPSSSSKGSTNGGSGDSSSPPRTSETTSSSFSSRLKRKKSRPQIVMEDDDFDDGAEADEEYVPPRAIGNGWVNMEGRRKHRESSKRGSTLEGSDERRHTIGV